MVRLILRWVLILMVMLLISGCDNIGLQPGERIITPENRLIPVAGTWKVEKLVMLPGRDAENQEMDSWLGTISMFDENVAVFGNDSCLAPKYKIKRVNTRQYLAYNYKIEPQDIGLQAATVEVVSITSNEQPFYDLIKINDNRAVLYKNEVFYFLERIDEKVEKVFADASSEDDLLRSGVLLGLRSEQNNYRTLWISARNRELKPVVALPDLIIPRKSGFWVVGVEHQPLQDNLFAYSLTNNADELSGDNKKQVTTDNQRQKILFAGNDYIATAYGRAVNGETPVLADLRVLPTDNLTGSQSGVKISDVTGEEGRKAMFSAAAHSRLFVSNRKLAQLEEIPRETNFTLVRHNGHWVMRGRLNTQGLVDQQEFIDFNINVFPPLELVKYDELSVAWLKVKEAVPSAVDAYTSPNRDMALIVSRDAIYIYPIQGDLLEQRLLQKIPLQQGEEVVMAEWATGPYAEQWAGFIGARELAEKN